MFFKNAIMKYTHFTIAFSVTILHLNTGTCNTFHESSLRK